MIIHARAVSKRNSGLYLDTARYFRDVSGYGLRAFTIIWLIQFIRPTLPGWISNPSPCFNRLGLMTGIYVKYSLRYIKENRLNHEIKMLTINRAILKEKNYCEVSSHERLVKSEIPFLPFIEVDIVDKIMEGIEHLHRDRSRLITNI